MEIKLSNTMIEWTDDMNFSDLFLEAGLEVPESVIEDELEEAIENGFEGLVGTSQFISIAKMNYLARVSVRGMKFRVKIETTTEKAVKVSSGKLFAWIPKSAMKLNFEADCLGQPFALIELKPWFKANSFLSKIIDSTITFV